MPTNYILVDFENVKPDLSLLANTSNRVTVFFGAKQQEGRVPFNLFETAHKLGGNFELFKVMRSGKNALDMHIAYYIGRLIQKEPGATIHIISGDTDFDPLAEYLRANGVDCHRTKTIAEILKQSGVAKPASARQSQARPRPGTPGAKSAKSAAQPVRKSEGDRLAPIIKHLYSLSGKPATRKKLAQTIGSYLRQHGGALSADAVEHHIDELIRMKYVSQSGNKVSYHLT